MEEKKQPTEAYMEFRFEVTPYNPWVEILIAELAEFPFDTFQETEKGLNAYIKEEESTSFHPDDLQIMNNKEVKIHLSIHKIEQKDWNSVWESNFHPIEIGDNCRIRAPFHPKKEVGYDILVIPKMAFGTGHHATTYLMVKYILEEEFKKGENILDMGCGTGILSILAEKRGANSIISIDNDPWSFENCKENIALNHCKKITPILGDASVLKGHKFNLILANITRNILLKDLPKYAKVLSSKGQIILSGFFSKDLSEIQEKAHQYGLELMSCREKGQWVAAKFSKI